MQASGLARIYSHASAARVVLAAGLILSVIAALLVAGQLEREARLKFESAVNDARAAIDTRVNDYADVLRGVGGLFAAMDAVSRAEFARYQRRSARLSGFCDPAAGNPAGVRGRDLRRADEGQRARARPRPGRRSGAPGRPRAHARFGPHH